MANPESLFPVPYSQGEGLTLPQRRSLTRQADTNPIRNEARALIPLAPDEVIQIVAWTNNAGTAIRGVEETIIDLPGEVRTSMTEVTKEEISQREEKKSIANLNFEQKVRGFFTLNSSGESTVNTNAKTDTSIKRDRARTGEHIAKTRPGQFLTGDQVRDALDRVSIARREGLLYLPALHSELGRHQANMLEKTRRMLEDHGEGNASWAEDIQQGAVEGLIGQLSQSVESYINGYIPDTLKDDVDPNISKTIDEQVWVTLENSFVNLLRFSLIEGRNTSIIQAGRAIQKCLLEDIYPKDTTRFNSLMNRWYQIFLGEKPTQNAQLIGAAFAETFAEGVFKSRNDELIFGELNELSGNVAQNGGAKLLFDAMTTKFRQDEPNARILSLMKTLSSVLIVDIQKRKTVEPNLISLIRASLIKAVDVENPELTESLIAQLSQFSKSTPEEIYIDYFGHELSLSTLLAMARSIKRNEWDDLVKKQGKSPDDISLSLRFSIRFPRPRNVDLDGVENYDLTAILRNVFYRTLNGYFHERPLRRIDNYQRSFDEYALILLFSQLTPEQQNALTTKYRQFSLETIIQALDFVDKNNGNIMQLASSRIFAEKKFDEKQKLPDPRIVEALRTITEIELQTASAKIRDKKLEDQIGKVVNLFGILLNYSGQKHNIEQKKPSDQTRKTFEDLFNNKFEDISRNLRIIVLLKEAFKTPESD